jgi:hypothetical protein
LGNQPTLVGSFFWHVKSLLWFLLIRTKLKLGLTITTKVGIFILFFKNQTQTWDFTYLCVEQRLEPKYMSLKEKVIRITTKW